MNNNLLEMVSSQKLIDAIPFKNLFIFKRNAEINVGSCQIKPQLTKSSILQTERSLKIHTKFNNINSLSCLLSVPKKSQSIGYKQYKQQGIKKGSLLKFRSTQRQSQRYQSREVQKEGRKSIFSLRKKFSVEPTSKYITDPGNAICRSSILHFERGLNKSQIDSKKFFKNELKSIIREIKEEEHHFCVHGLTSSKNLPQQNSNFPKFVPGDGVKPKLKVGLFPNKPYYILNKRKVDKIGGKINDKTGDKIKFNQINLKVKSKCSLIAARTQDKQQDVDLCGWSNRSFYPNSSLLSFKNTDTKLGIYKENVQ